MPKRKLPDNQVFSNEDGSEKPNAELTPILDSGVHSNEENETSNSPSTSYVLSEDDFGTAIGPLERSLESKIEHMNLEEKEENKNELSKNRNSLEREDKILYACSICHDRFPEYSKFKEHIEKMHKRRGDSDDFVDFCLLRIYETEVTELLLSAHCGDRRLSIMNFDNGERGVITGAIIPKGEIIIQYTGDLVSHEELKSRSVKYGDVGIFMRLNEHKKIQYIDATIKGNCSRYIRHGHPGNVHSLVTTCGKEKVVLIYAKRNIKRGEELTYDYNTFYVPTKEDLYPLDKL